MGEDSQQLVTAIGTVDSVGRDNFLRLRELIDRYFALPDAAEHLDVWFQLYERFPNGDLDGLEWSILHKIEDQLGWAGLVVASVRRQPAYFPVLMVNRLLNAGIASVGGVDLLCLLREVAADEECLTPVRDAAERFLDHQLHHPLTGKRYAVDTCWPRESTRSGTGR
jgi:hypothetical protein